MRKSNRTQVLDVLSSGSTSLSLPENLSFEDWRNIGAQLAHASGRLNWLIGDWWAFGLHRYGERKAVVQSEDWHGPSYERCMNIAYVCQTFRETSRRREILSFGHHEAVAALPAAKADELLDWCLEGIDDRGRPRSIRELRAKVDEYWREHRASAPPPRDPWPPAERVVPVQVRNAEPQPTTLLVPSRPPERGIALDTSGGGGPVPPERAALTMQPPLAVDRIAIARAALAALTPDERIRLLTECAAEIHYRFGPIPD